MKKRIRSEIFVLLLAVQFLTRIPLTLNRGYSPERMAASVRHYPLVGVAIGAVAAGTFALSLLTFPSVVAVLVSTGVVLLMTGGFHEDGLSDTFDGIGGGLTADDSLKIMRDSRIGVVGALSLVVVLALKVASLNALEPRATVVCLVAAHGLSRYSSVLVIATSRYVRAHGTGKPTAEGIGAASLVYATVVGCACLVLVAVGLSFGSALGAFLGVGVGHGLARAFFEPKLGGYTGDCLGATQQLSEVGLYLGVLACQ